MDAHALADRFGTPLYAYDLAVVRARCRALRAAIRTPRFQPLFAIKACPVPLVAKAIVDEGFGIDAVSPGEVALALRLGVPPDLVLYTENNMTDGEQAEAVAAGVLVNTGSLDRLDRLGAAGVREAAIRINPDFGDGMHEKVCTAGPLTKFGIHHSQMAAAVAISRRHGLRIVGAHMHIGSGFLDAAAFARSCAVIFATARQLPDLRFVDVGGGLGIPYKPEDRPIDLPAVGAALDAAFAAFCRDYGRDLELRLEPGRMLVAESGRLLTRVTSVKTTPEGRRFVGCDTGFNHLVRPAMYGSYHRIENLTRPDAPAAVCDVVGNICESGDIFARDRAVADPRVGDLLALADAGAYGSAMASTYNTRPLPAEVVIDGGEVRLARRRQTVAELLDAWEW
jgi:diaminopimelate decarboxylase